MIGYMDAVIQRQDRANLMSKMETFTVESASRRSVRELVDSFQKQQNDNNLKTTSIEVKIAALTKKYEDTSLLLAKHAKKLDEIKMLELAVKQVQGNMDAQALQTSANIIRLEEKMEVDREYFDKKIRNLTAQDMQIALC